MAARGTGWIESVWYGESAAYRPLLPLAWLYAGVTAVRRALYRQGRLAVVHPGVPVIVVGNLTAGGTGKTPVAIWLANAFRRRGRTVGIVSRGYRGQVGPEPLIADGASDPAQVGDEPVVMARRSGCLVAVHPDRVAASRLLVSRGVDLVIADDGLQHYRLGRDVEIAVVDGARGFGNGRLLPAGPLREPPARLGQVDRILLQGAGTKVPAPLPDGVPAARFTLRIGIAVSLRDGSQRPLTQFRGETVHAVAGIGNPARFFDALEAEGLDVVRHPLPDHAAIGANDVDFGDGRAVLMTEKDAVKCALVTDRLWYVPAELEFAGDEDDWLAGLAALIDTGKRA